MSLLKGSPAITGGTRIGVRIAGRTTQDGPTREGGEIELTEVKAVMETPEGITQAKDDIGIRV